MYNWVIFKKYQKAKMKIYPLSRQSSQHRNTFYQKENKQDKHYNF